MTKQLFKTKPVLVEAMQWTGKKEEAEPIINWMQDNGVTATWLFRSLVTKDGKNVNSIEVKPRGKTFHLLRGDWLTRDAATGELHRFSTPDFTGLYELASNGTNHD
jgi:hypothetical protein